MKAEELKQRLDFKNIEEVLAYCLECNISLNEISFEPLKLNLNTTVVESLIEESKNINFQKEALFLLANKNNVPKNIEKELPIKILKMALHSNIKKDFLYSNDKLNLLIKEAIFNSNNVLKTQYLSLLTGVGSCEEMKDNAIAIHGIIEEMKAFNEDLSRQIKSYVDKICLDSMVINDRTTTRKEIWLNVTNVINKKQSLKI